MPLTRGDFFLATTNQGHAGVASFGADPQLRVDFGYRADQVVALVAKRLITLHYGQGPRYSYFDGCSQGGHQGSTEAQRYPHDCDGIVAGAPPSLLQLIEARHEPGTLKLVFGPRRHPLPNPDVDPQRRLVLLHPPIDPPVEVAQHPRVPTIRH